MSNTKIVSFRVPTDTYSQMLSRAIDAKMTISDYAFHLIFRSGNEAVATANERVKQLASDNKEHTQNLAALRQQLEQANKSIASLEKQVQQVYSELKKRHNATIHEAVEYFKEKDENSLMSSYKDEIMYFEDKYW